MLLVGNQIKVGCYSIFVLSGKKAQILICQFKHECGIPMLVLFYIKFQKQESEEII